MQIQLQVFRVEVPRDMLVDCQDDLDRCHISVPESHFVRLRQQEGRSEKGRTKLHPYSSRLQIRRADVQFRVLLHPLLGQTSYDLQTK